jgi:hypothetical protein
MTQLNIDLENCYGIKKLKTQFDFSGCKACAIYAPNGAMKSSLAQTFQDIADGAISKDRIFPARTAKRTVTDKSGQELPQESILVVRPYDEVFGHTEKTSTLLVNASLKKEYEQLHVEIDLAKQAFLAALKEQSGSKKDLEKEISSTFTQRDDSLFLALTRIKEELFAQTSAPLASVPYDTLFDEKVLSFLENKNTKSAIESYIKKYNELLAASTYFKKGTFNYYNASTIAKSLASNGFFEAKHTIKLNAETSVEVSTETELEALIAKEKDSLLSDKDLKKKFVDVEKLITKNNDVRMLESYLANHEEILAYLGNIKDFREHVWKSYIWARLDLYRTLIDKFQAAEARKKEIESQAGVERTQWQSVINIFNERFFVPFKLTAKNFVSVVLGRDSMLSLGFTFEDGTENVDVEKPELMKALSTGEKKALYVLNVIFEIETRKRAGQETLIVVDDIADSFDYRNKYAIIQYLKEIAELPNFRQLILTHNFDFFRTVNSRFVAYKNCFMASKGAGGLTLSPAAGIQNVFVNDWKLKFFDDPRKRIASIPFIRNLIEFTRGDQDAEYVQLTSLLHWKANSAQITQSHLDSIYNKHFGGAQSSGDGQKSVVDLIAAEAEGCLKAKDGINFENKIVLSIAIRLAAEQFMVNSIDDSAFVAAIESNQTTRLLSRFMVVLGANHKAVGALQRVVLMTPENIHLNSFMYEPILDMSDEHLRRLYKEVLELK